MQPPASTIRRPVGRLWRRPACGRGCSAQVSNIEHYRTTALGSHIEACEDCGHARMPTTVAATGTAPSPRGAVARTWLAEREADLLPVGYFHVVFTVPADVADIAFDNKAAVYDLLFHAVSETKLTSCSQHSPPPTI